MNIRNINKKTKPKDLVESLNSGGLLGIRTLDPLIKSQFL